MTHTSYLPTTCKTPELTEKQARDLQDYITELTREGRHLEASTLYASFFPWG